jgi:putative adhesin
MRLRNVIAAGAVLGAGLLLTGCGLQNIGAPTKEEAKSYDLTEKVSVLRVDSGSGDIVVTESARTGLHVTETMHWKGDKPTTRHPVSGDTVSLSYDCSDSVDWGCDVDYQVEVPRGMRVKVDTGSGDITLRAVSGELSAKTGSGTIDARELGGKKAVAETGSGDVELRFTGTPDDVNVGTGSGTGIVRVPDGTYNVTTQSGSGDKKIEVTSDKASPRRIVVKTGSGDAKVLKA